MSGWIKWEKDLENDPRFKRMVNALLSARNIPPCNATPLQVAQHVTVVSGALLRMWVHADTYLRDDDTFDMSPDDLNLYLGIPEFSSICCADWFVETHDGRVQLPGFNEKNSPEQRERDQTAKRVARHRAKKCNAPPLPDQTRPDQTRPDQTRPDQKEESTARVRALAVAGLDLKSWETWIEYRARRKPAIKTASLVAAAEQLAAFGAEQAAVVKHSIANGYQGLFAPKTGANGKHPDDTGWTPAGDPRYDREARR